MVKVSKIGKKRITYNPRNPKESTVTFPVTLIEEGRGGLNQNLTQSADLLSEWAGAPVGLPQARTHTFPVKAEQIGKFTKAMNDKEDLPFFVNRTLTSVPSMTQQENVEGRIIDGKLTYVSTTLSRAQEPDKDQRVSLETSAQIDPERIRKARTGTAEVHEVEETEQVQQTVQHETLTQ